jgi:hypothetical protein
MIARVSRTCFAVAYVLLGGPGAIAQPSLTASQARLEAAAAEVSEAELRRTIEQLVGFGTRHTLSDTRSNTRGIGAARRWTQRRFEAIAQACGGCLQIATVGDGHRRAYPQPDSGGQCARHPARRQRAQPGDHHLRPHRLARHRRDGFPQRRAGRQRRRLGRGAVIEAARVLSKHRFPATLVYAVLSGEEQGLHGGKVLADYAKSRGWQVEAVLNNDIVGNTQGSSGVVDNTRVRVFSEALRRWRRRSRRTAGVTTAGRWTLPRATSRASSTGSPSAPDQPGCGHGLPHGPLRARRRPGPHAGGGLPLGAHHRELRNYDWQHQDLRTENGKRYGDTIDAVDFPYLAKVTRLNVAAMAALAAAPMPPLEVSIEGAVKPDTTVSWTPSPAGPAIGCGGAPPPRRSGSTAARPAPRRGP